MAANQPTDAVAMDRETFEAVQDTLRALYAPEAADSDRLHALLGRAIGLNFSELKS